MPHQSSSSVRRQIVARLRSGEPVAVLADAGGGARAAACLPGTSAPSDQPRAAPRCSLGTGVVHRRSPTSFAVSFASTARCLRSARGFASSSSPQAPRPQSHRALGERSVGGRTRAW